MLPNYPHGILITTELDLELYHILSALIHISSEIEPIGPHSDAINIPLRAFYIVVSFNSVPACLLMALEVARKNLYNTPPARLILFPPFFKKCYLLHFYLFLFSTLCYLVALHSPPSRSSFPYLPLYSLSPCTPSCLGAPFSFLSLVFCFPH